VGVPGAGRGMGRAGWMAGAGAIWRGRKRRRGDPARLRRRALLDADKDRRGCVWSPAGGCAGCRRLVLVLSL